MNLIRVNQAPYLHDNALFVGNVLNFGDNDGIAFWYRHGSAVLLHLGLKHRVEDCVGDVTALLLRDVGTSLLGLGGETHLAFFLVHLGALAIVDGVALLLGHRLALPLRLRLHFGLALVLKVWHALLSVSCLALLVFHCLAFSLVLQKYCSEFKMKTTTVTYTESGTSMLNWDSRYLCHFSTKMAEIWSPGTSFQDVWTCKISALYLLYFHSYETFSVNH